MSALLNHYILDKGFITAEAQHNLMAEYAEALGSSLASWDNHRIPEPINNDEMSYYEALAWSGEMLDTDAFDDLESEDQSLINDANKN